MLERFRRILLGLLLAVPAPVMAQVGHAPDHSPYHELIAKQSASLITGYLTGSRGVVNVGPSEGPLFGIRYDHIIGAPVDIQVGLSYAHLKRYSVDPSLPVALRTTGPVNQDVLMMETGLSLVVMGRKTWHGLSPYLGGTVGVAFETGLSSDFSGYQFGTRGIVAPHLGFKWYPKQAFSVKVEARDYFWKLTYPPSYAIPPVSTLPTVLPAGTALTEWTMHPAVIVSIGYTFLPF